MNPADNYLKWIEWSEVDGVYIGKCPDLITGIYGDDPISLYSELCEVIEDIITHFQSEDLPLPPANTRPMQEVA